MAHTSLRPAAAAGSAAAGPRARAAPAARIPPENQLSRGCIPSCGALQSRGAAGVQPEALLLHEVDCPCSTPSTSSSTACSSSAATRKPSSGRRHTLTALAVATGGGAAAALVLPPPHASAAAIACPGERGYALQQCLREARKAREQAKAAAAAGGDGNGGSSSSSGAAGGGAGGGDVEAERLRYRQYEQPGELVTLPSGLQYRELATGSGREAGLGSACEIHYVIYRLASGAYYKYSSGGTPVYLFSFGYGKEGRDDLGETYNFVLGDPAALPRAVTAGLVGMREGGRRRILVPPRAGWSDAALATSGATRLPGPPPPSFGASRRLASHRDEALLFEAELVRVRAGPGIQQPLRPPQEPGLQYQLPAPPSPFKDKLG